MEDRRCLNALTGLFRVSTAELSATNGNPLEFLGLGGLCVVSSLLGSVGSYGLAELHWAAFYSLVEAGTRISPSARPWAVLFECQATEYWNPVLWRRMPWKQGQTSISKLAASSKDTLENNRGQGASRIREQRQGTPSFSTTDSPVHYPVFSLDYSRFEFARLLSQIVRCSTFSIATAKRRLRTAHESSNSQGIRIFAAHDGLHGYGDARRRNENKWLTNVRKLRTGNWDLGSGVSSARDHLDVITHVGGGNG
ncbi:hypothetical protein CEP51_010965 [Fusarium floridanum]|uniref:Uncharacterized protein n=1 Tax=Fusarium floridanum TaxID=1325733 RepID=A0A428RCS6_9HYPO|nr:hypothetical protein CEP51_010965 [Fusarium floridanum]